ncbi:cytochrome b [Hoeflea marina]|uniref:Cytochrome b n=1 Tax=Hoeflea marina TaxID=274592 RepID=A0A317PVJ2_9HYPH|nr:cytochrome b/b6 domain-containing protein [Hoeflea marina]PWW04296.1 cytochrome b [Hoeflea marina]
MRATSTMMEADGAMPSATVRVWDPLVRIFHWSLVGLFGFAFATGDEWSGPHELAGYAIAALVAVRVIWGLLGSRHARFSSFVARPSKVAGFLSDTARLRAQRHLGHNPAGGAMVVALLIAISVIAASGYMMTTDRFWGVDWVQSLHEAAVYGTLGLIALHVGGVLLASIEHSENLVAAMITGRKRAPAEDDIA